MIKITYGKFWQNLNLDIKLPFKFVPRQLFMPFLMTYVSTLYSQYFLGSTLLKGIGKKALFIRPNCSRRICYLWSLQLAIAEYGPLAQYVGRRICRSLNTTVGKYVIAEYYSHWKCHHWICQNRGRWKCHCWKWRSPKPPTFMVTCDYGAAQFLAPSSWHT